MTDSELRAAAQVVLDTAETVDWLTELTPALIQLRSALSAEPQIDEMQRRLNNGSYCFHVLADGSYCGRAETWAGHVSQHTFVQSPPQRKPVIVSTAGWMDREPPHCPTCSCGGPEFETVAKAEFDALLAERDRLQAVVDGSPEPFMYDEYPNGAIDGGDKEPADHAYEKYFHEHIAPEQSTKGSR